MVGRWANAKEEQQPSLAEGGTGLGPFITDPFDEASCVTRITAAAATLNINGPMHFSIPSYSNSNQL
jgi:hypothetical protein